MFGVLRGDHCLNSVESSLIEISEEALVYEDILKENECKHTIGVSGGCVYHTYKMLYEAFTVNTLRARAPRDIIILTELKV